MLAATFEQRRSDARTDASTTSLCCTTVRIRCKPRATCTSPEAFQRGRCRGHSVSSGAPSVHWSPRRGRAVGASTRVGIVAKVGILPDRRSGCEPSQAPDVHASVSIAGGGTRCSSGVPVYATSPGGEAAPARPGCPRVRACPRRRARARPSAWATAGIASTSLGRRRSTPLPARRGAARRCQGRAWRQCPSLLCMSAGQWAAFDPMARTTLSSPAA